MYKEQGYYIFYTDETWASPDLAFSRCCQLFLEKAELKNFMNYTTDKVLQNTEGYTGGFIVKGGQGRVIIDHAGGNKGFVSGKGVEDVFISKKYSADYHSSMNAEHFNSWFKTLVDNVEDKTVIVLDRAPYHRDRVPDTIMCKMYQNKDKLINSLLLRKLEKPKGIADYHALTKKELMAWSEKHPIKVKYEIKRIAETSGKDIKVLWLPVAHCELNPIELIWSVVKGHIAKNNSIGGTKRVHQLSIEAIRAVGPLTWKNCCDHAIREEEKMKARDLELDNVVIDEELGDLLKYLEI